VNSRTIPPTTRSKAFYERFWRFQGGTPQSAGSASSRAGWSSCHRRARSFRGLPGSGCFACAKPRLRRRVFCCPQAAPCPPHPPNPRLPPKKIGCFCRQAAKTASWRGTRGLIGGKGRRFRAAIPHAARNPPQARKVDCQAQAPARLSRLRSEREFLAAKAALKGSGALCSHGGASVRRRPRAVRGAGLPCVATRKAVSC
jgi:hypothetical protein